MVKLRFFDGTSSADADSVEFRSSDDSFQMADLIELVLRGFVSMGGFAVKEMKIALKKRRVKRLREAVLPDYPFSLICPLCLEIVRRSGREYSQGT